MLRRPDGIAENARWLFLVLAVVSLFLTVPAVVSSSRGALLLSALAAGIILGSSWICGYRSKRVPFGLDVIDAAAMTGIALACPNPATVLGVTFASVWFRALYGSTMRSLARVGLYVAALVGAVALWPLLHGTAIEAAPVLGVIPTLLLTVIVARQLGIGLLAREQGILRDKALATTGSRLLGVTDDTSIKAIAWTALTEICAATGGLRLLKVARHGSALRVEGATGGFHTVPGVLPGEIISSAAGRERATVVDQAPLNAAAGTSLTWACISLPAQDEDAWLLVGAPKKVPAEAMLSVRALVNHVALALRNSDVHQQLSVKARFDSLTGLDNRASFTDKLSSALAHGASADGLHVLFLDLDDFKDVNDVLGHRAGDEFLIDVSKRMRRCTRPEDVCARLGGDEFAVLLHATTEATAIEIAQRLVTSIADPMQLGGRTARVGASIGIAAATPGVDIEDLVHQADVAMYAAKANGKGQVLVFNPGLLQTDATRVSFEWELAAAAVAGELVVFYQPIVSMTNLRCTGVEALVRWQRPGRGLLVPEEFIAAAERTGAVVDIGAFVLHRACADAALWQTAHGGAPLTMHVNVSASELETDDFVDIVMACLRDSGVPAHQLVLELTETVALDSVAAIGRLQALAAHGIAIAIDDFGTGYSSLTTLRSLPVGIIKLDTSFTAGALTNHVDRGVITAIVQLGTELGIQTVAQGVERVEQQQFLQETGVDAAQGYLYADPLPAAQLFMWLRHRDSDVGETTPLRDNMLTPRSPIA